MGLLLFLVGCAGAPARVPPPPVVDPADPELCGPYGCPRNTTDLATHSVRRAGYRLEHSDLRKTALWVVHHPSRAEVDAEVDGHRPKWRADPLLPPGLRAEDEDYRSATDLYDRGHLAPNADFGTPQGRKETFFLSNAVPQHSANNQGLWRALEEQVRTWVRQKGELWIITGPIYEPSTIGIGPGRVAVPVALYKILLAVDEQGRPQVLAFVANNGSYASPYALSALRESVDVIEARTGLDFFPELPVPLEATVEGRVGTWW